MKITFLGAARTVTGSCYLVEAGGSRFLVDCGMFQGHTEENFFNGEPFPFNIEDLDFIFLTHAHIDHSGRIPKIYVDGYRGPVYATKATAELCAIMLPDSGHIQEMENEWTNRKLERAGKPAVKPLYTYQDALDSLSLFKKIRYGEIINPSKNIRARFNDAGHMLGSSILEIWYEEDGREQKIVFSGDLGNKDIPVLREPSIIEDADYLIIESTYGNRLHEENENKVERFFKIINETIEKGGNVIIPSFAVGRTQEIIYELHKEKEKYGPKLEKFMKIPVFIDSPLAISATEVFRNNLDCYDEEARRYIENGDNPLDFPGLVFTRTAEESKSLNERAGSAIIISSSGMCEAGRIKHHLKHNLWRSECTILFVGYQAQGTLGRRIVDGAKKVKLFGEEISVNARIEMIEGFSGHADKAGLLSWIGAFTKKPRKIFVVHGESEVSEEFAEVIRQEFGIDAIVPAKGDIFDTGEDFVIRKVPGYEESMKFRRLAVLVRLEAIKEEFDKLSDIIRDELKRADDKQVDRILSELKRIEEGILDAEK